jgi:hypothetical protein
MAAIAKAVDLRDALTRVVSHDPDALAWIEGGGRLVVGRYPSARAAFDFAAEAFAGDPLAGDSRPIVSAPPIAGRRTGVFELKTPLARYQFVSGKELLVRGLEAIEREKPGTLEKLAKHRGRTKRMVARRKEELYEKPHLAHLSEEVAPGWYASTNSSSAEVIKTMRRAIEAAGWRWGADAEAARLS